VRLQTPLQPWQNHGEGHAGSVAIRSFLITGGSASELLQAVDETFHPMVLPVQVTIENWLYLEAAKRDKYHLPLLVEMVIITKVSVLTD
jgi:hypothetical protein